MVPKTVFTPVQKTGFMLIVKTTALLTRAYQPLTLEVIAFALDRLRKMCYKLTSVITLAETTSHDIVLAAKEASLKQ